MITRHGRYIKPSASYRRAKPELDLTSKVLLASIIAVTFFAISVAVLLTYPY